MKLRPPSWALNVFKLKLLLSEAFNLLHSHNEKALSGTFEKYVIPNCLLNASRTTSASEFIPFVD